MDNEINLIYAELKELIATLARDGHYAMLMALLEYNQTMLTLMSDPSFDYRMDAVSRVLTEHQLPCTMYYIGLN